MCFFISGFSTVRRNLCETRLSLKNERLNSILMIKINMPCLRKIIKDCDQVVVEAAVKRYFEKKKWRWNIHKTDTTVVKKDEFEDMYGEPPKKMRKVQGVMTIDSDKEDSEDYETDTTDSEIDSDSDIGY